MQSRRLVSAIGVTGLAAAAALLTCNLIQAADSGARAPGAGERTGFYLGSGGTNYASVFAPFGRKLDWAERVHGPFLSVDPALIRTVSATADRPKATEPEARAIEPGRGVEAKAQEELTADEARQLADQEGLFDVAPMGHRIELVAAKDAQGEKGRQVYQKICYACHQPDGRGVPGVFPMLAQSDYLAADRARAIGIVLRGLSGPVTVNGRTTNSVMPALGAELKDHEIADVLTYVFNAWENPGGAFTAEQVGDIRRAKP